MGSPFFGSFLWRDKERGSPHTRRLRRHGFSAWRNHNQHCLVPIGSGVLGVAIGLVSLRDGWWVTAIHGLTHLRLIGHSQPHLLTRLALRIQYRASLRRHRNPAAFLPLSRAI